MDNIPGEDLLKKMKSIKDSLDEEYKEYQRRSKLMYMVCNDPEYVEAKTRHDEYCAFLKEQKKKADDEFRSKTEEITTRIYKELWPEEESSAE